MYQDFIVEALEQGKTVTVKSDDKRIYIESDMDKISLPKTEDRLHQVKRYVHYMNHYGSDIQDEGL